MVLRTLVTLQFRLVLVGGLVAMCSASMARANDKPVIPLRHTHAHNDYEHPRPLFDALDHGFCSVEADVFLVDGRLLVGHTRQALKPERTLESLYLDPLRKRIQANGGRVYRGGPVVYLLIDVKTEAKATYAAVDKVLARYADIVSVTRDGRFTEKALTAVISGNRARDMMTAQTVRFAGIDGRLADLDAALTADLMPWVSDRWGLYFRWHGEGPMPELERARLRDYVRRAHAHGRLLRFWATPEKMSVWKELRAADVDLINTDKLAEVAQFLSASNGSAADKSSFPRFSVQEIDTGLKVGYAVLLVDINGDGKKDILVVDTNRVVWYENPTWKRHTLIQGQTKPDNVCVAAYDIDGDGQLDIALGADWKPFNTKDGNGTLQWLRRGKTLEQPWSMFPIGTEPTVHRMRFADLDGSGKAKLIVAPLMGRDSTKDKNWMDGAPVRLLAFTIPKDPVRDRWVPEVIDQGLHVIHNFQPVPAEGGKGMDILVASYEGVSRLQHRDGRWVKQHLGDGNQDNPRGNRGSSEIKQGRLKNGKRYIATIEPWHGHQVVVYTEPNDPSQPKWERHVIDDQLKWGHAVWCADLDGDGDDELIIGVRDDLSTRPNQRRGVRIYKAVDGKGVQWERRIVEDGGVAVEDLAAADLNGDGRIDIVAVGRQTGNVRIYWNEGAGK